MVHQPGVVVFKRNSNGVYHMGIYVGRDRVIEAKGAMHGVVVSQFSADPAWNAWGYFDWLIYDIVDTDVEQLPVITDALTYGPLPGYPDIRTSTAEVVQLPKSRSIRPPIRSKYPERLGFSARSISILRFQWPRSKFQGRPFSLRGRCRFQCIRLS